MSIFDTGGLLITEGVVGREEVSELPEGRRGEIQEGPDCSSAAHSKGKREHPVVAADPR